MMFLTGRRHFLFRYIICFNFGIDSRVPGIIGNFLDRVLSIPKILVVNYIWFLIHLFFSLENCGLLQKGSATTKVKEATEFVPQWYCDEWDTSEVWIWFSFSIALILNWLFWHPLSSSLNCLDIKYLFLFRCIRNGETTNCSWMQRQQTRLEIGNMEPCKLKSDNSSDFIYFVNQLT